MTSWSDDEGLAAALAEAVADAGAVTDRDRELARAAFTWRSVDAELLELLHDSALEEGAAVRGTTQVARVLSFSRPGLTVELEIDGEVLLGQVMPAQGASVSVQRADGRDSRVEADSAGFFRVEDLMPGLVRLVITTVDATVVTPWVLV